MKRYVTGLLALGLAIGTVAFTTKPKKMINGKEVASASDPCTSQNMRWFLMNLDCDDQVNFSDLTASGNYTETTSQTEASTCTGSTCVCAIFACVSSNGISPVISSGTSIYAALSNWFNFGQTSNIIGMKDDFVQARKK